MTPEQLEAAEKFLLVPCRGEKIEVHAIQWDDFVRIVAWYGEIRFQAGKAGLEGPGGVVVVTDETIKKRALTLVNGIPNVNEE